MEAIKVLPRQSMLQRTVEQIVEIPVPAGGGPHLPDPGASSSSAVSRDERGQGVLRTFTPGVESARSAGSFECEGAPALELMDAGGLSCRGVGVPGHRVRVLQIRRRLIGQTMAPVWGSVCLKALCSHGDWHGAFAQVQWDLPRRGLNDAGGGGAVRRRQGGARLSGVILRRSTEAFGRIHVCRVARFALGNMERYFVEALYLTTWSVPGYCRVEYEKLEPLGDVFVLGRNAWFDSGYI